MSSIDGNQYTIAKNTKSITLNAYGKTFKNVNIVSDADKTVINRMNIEGNGTIPLQISSPDITINQSKITNSGICAAFTADDLTLDLYGPSTMVSGGPNTLFCKDTSVVRTSAGLKTSLTLNGNLVTCGTITDPNKFIQFASGKNQWSATGFYRGDQNIYIRLHVQNMHRSFHRIYFKRKVHDTCNYSCRRH